MNKQSNIILIVSDTFRWDLLGERFSVKENVYAKTPNLNRLAQESIVFERAYHASFPTVPARADLLTGRFTFTYYDWSPLPRDWIVLPQILKRAGYISMLIADTPHILKDGYNFDRGFDGWIWIRGQENDRYRTDPIDVKIPCSPQKLRNVETVIQHMRNNALRRFEEDWIPARTAMEAVRWLERNYKRRFFLYVDFFDPHEPWDPPRWYIDAYDPGYIGEEVSYPAYGPCDYLSKAELEHIRALYAGEATLVDKWIGVIIRKIEELGILENTTIIFTSDHGIYLGEHGLIGKSVIMGGYHGLVPLYEEVCHIPLLVRLADNTGGKEEHQKIDELVLLPDITATIIELADAKDEGLLQGRSLMSLINGESKEWRSFAVSTPSLMHGARASLRVTITSKEWSLILAPKIESRGLEKATYTLIVDGVPRILKPFGKIDTELYNLKKDPQQKRNVLDENMNVALDLRSKFIKFLREIGAEKEIIKPWQACKSLD